MDGLNQAQRSYDRDIGESESTLDSPEFSFDDMSKEKYAAREARKEAIKREVMSKLYLRPTK